MISRRELGFAGGLAVALTWVFAWTQVLPFDGIPVLGTDYGQMVWNMWSVERAVSMGAVAAASAGLPLIVTGVGALPAAGCAIPNIAGERAARTASNMDLSDLMGVF